VAGDGVGVGGDADGSAEEVGGPETAHVPIKKKGSRKR
jgi:hypothetical protein